MAEFFTAFPDLKYPKADGDSIDPGSTSSSDPRVDSKDDTALVDKPELAPGRPWRTLLREAPVQTSAKRKRIRKKDNRLTAQGDRVRDIHGLRVQMKTDGWGMIEIPRAGQTSQWIYQKPGDPIKYKTLAVVAQRYYPDYLCTDPVVANDSPSRSSRRRA